jgi:putative inorganic carbon (hco3(-)) transporter
VHRAAFATGGTPATTSGPPKDIGMHVTDGIPATDEPSGVTGAMLAMRPRALWLAFKAERLSFVAISIYLFLEYVRPESAYSIFGILPFRRIFLVLALAGFCFDKRAKIPNSAINWLLILFLAQCAVSSYLAYRPDYSFDNFTVIWTWFVIYFLIIGIVTTERRVFLFVVVYLLANLKMSQFGFFTWLKRGFGFASWGLSGAGWFKNSGELGLEMAMFFAYTLCLGWFLSTNWTGWRKWLMYFMPLSAAACVLASSSRGALVGSLAVIVYLSLFAPRRIRLWLTFAPLVYLAYLIVPDQFLARFHSAGQDATSLARIHYWEKAREMLKEHPYFGVGYYNWTPYYRDHYFDPTLYWRVEEAHNTFLQIAAELGYIGIGLFLMIVLATFLINLRSERSCRKPGFEFLRALSLGMNAAGVGLIVASLFLTAFFLPNYWIHFALTVVIARVIKAKLAAAAAQSRSALQPTLASPG